MENKTMENKSANHKTTEPPQNPSTRAKIQKLLKEHPILLFMKGSPAEPSCGFSSRVSQILNFMKVPFHHYDVLSDEEIRSGIKEYAQWPTIPQLYVNGEFIGGCDIVQEQFETGELEKLLSDFKK